MFYYWNLRIEGIVSFREGDGSLRPLPKKHIDCGLGFERLTSVIQGYTSNYDTDLFKPIFDAIEKGTGSRPYTGKVGTEDVDQMDMSYRVVADHIRTLTIALSDGGRPDNAGRGYVLRRILRRGVRYATEKLNAKRGFFSTLVSVVVDVLGDTFPELRKDPQSVIDVINDEEEQFLKTLSRGHRLLSRCISKLGDSKIVPGDLAWRLYDTYGFPIDLTQLMAEENGLTINMNEYEEAKRRSQVASNAKVEQYGGGVDLDVHAIADLSKQEIKQTDDSLKYNYVALDETPEAEYKFEANVGKVVAIRRNGRFVSEATSGDECGLILDSTCFYSESGGQIYDQGFMNKVGDEEAEFSVKNVQVRGGYVIHIGEIEGTIKVNDKLRQTIDEVRRKLIMNNHTATHILNFGLRQVLGEADQKGSLVAPDRLRFDFTAKGAMTYAQIKDAESISMDMICRNEIVYAKSADLAHAKAVQGLRAVFEETYPDPVRIVSIGVPVDDLLADPHGPGGTITSVEFCGGTHLQRAGHVGKFYITSEDAIAKGIRRIVAVTGPEADKTWHRSLHFEKLVNDIGQKVDGIVSIADRLNLKQLYNEIATLIQDIGQALLPYWRKEDFRNELKRMKSKLDDMDKEYKQQIAQKVIEEAKSLSESHFEDTFLVHKFQDGVSAKALDSALKQIKNKASMVFSVDNDNQKIVCLASVAKLFGPQRSKMPKDN
uniref:Alanine--tRNA ligase n=1 Tax=Romanomermis culicivorax TaxID=13658 RepID=A0A915IAM8_ROMCU